MPGSIARRPLAVVALGLLPALAACGSDDDPAVEVPAPTTGVEASATTTAVEASGVEVEVEVAGGKVVAGGGRVKVPTGEEVRLVVRADVADEVHVHGYDREFAVPAGGEGSVTFVADLEGVWEVELHDAGLTLVELEVS